MNCVDNVKNEEHYYLFKELFWRVERRRGESAYIGMVFDFLNDDEAVIEMKSYINELREYTELVGEASTPADQNLFEASYNLTLYNLTLY